MSEFGTADSILKKGELMKKSKHLRIWRKYHTFNFSRVILLTPKNIYTFDKSNMNQPTMTISLN